MWSGSMGCMAATNGAPACIDSQIRWQRVQRGSTPSGPIVSRGSGTGSWPSQRGIDRKRESEASRFTRLVVPERGRPITMTGFSISMSRISGCCFSRSRMRSRFEAYRVQSLNMSMRPRPVRSGSASISASWRPSRSRKSSGPKSSRPVRSTAAAHTASTVSSVCTVSP